MNILFIVEGKRTEKKLYKIWIPYLCSSLNYVELIQEISIDSFTIISGEGYPGYFNIIKNAFQDIVDYNYNINYLFICVDSEQKDYHEKLSEIEEFIQDECCNIDSEVVIIVQNHCIETWLIGNKNFDLRCCM